MALPLPTLLPVGEKINLLAQPLKDGRALVDGQPPPVASVPVWAADDNGAYVTLTPSPDGLNCAIAAIGPVVVPGPPTPTVPVLVTVTCSVIGDDPLTPLVDAMQFQIVPAIANGVRIRAGRPVPQ